MIEILRGIAPLLAATSLAWIVYLLVSRLRIRPQLRRLLEDFYASSGNAAPVIPQSERVGLRIAGHLPISLGSWDEHLAWAQSGGYFKGWGVGRLVFVALIYGIAGAGILLLNQSPAALLAPLVATAYPFISVRARANTVRRRVVRSMPELATLVAAEMSAGISPDLALQHISALPGPLSGLLADVLAYARSHGRPLFGRKPIPGALVEVFTQAQLPELLSFAAQLDLVAEKGVAGAALMNQVARTLGREYRARLDSEIEKLEDRLMLATAVFFFIPFVLVILGSFIAPVMAIFR